MKIDHLKIEDSNEVAQFILEIQNLEFALNILPHEQTDLLHITDFYSGGGFWVAKIDNKVVGTIGLQKINPEIGVLRKMFVKKELRGAEPKIGQLLFETLLEKVRSIGLKIVYLDTPSVAKASHRFYERNGFIEVTDKSVLPLDYKFLDRNSKIYRLNIS